MSAAGKCVTLSIIFSYPMALAFALFFRFPVPLGGYIGPASDVGIDYAKFSDIFLAVSVAWVVYGIMGGFVVLGMGGAAASHLAFNKSINRGYSEKKVLVVLAACVSFLGCGTLAILDYVIGSW